MICPFGKLFIKDQKNKKVHRCLVCVGCLSSENKIGVRRFINRDINGALNILKCLKAILKGEERPSCLQRPRSKDLSQHGPIVKKKKVNLGFKSGPKPAL